MAKLPCKEVDAYQAAGRLSTIITMLSLSGQIHSEDKHSKTTFSSSDPDSSHTVDHALCNRPGLVRLRVNQQTLFGRELHENLLVVCEAAMVISLGLDRLAPRINPVKELVPR
jgi:hypothetical protein